MEKEPEESTRRKGKPSSWKDNIYNQFHVTFKKKKFHVIKETWELKVKKKRKSTPIANNEGKKMDIIFYNKYYRIFVMQGHFS